MPVASSEMSHPPLHPCHLSRSATGGISGRSSNSFQATGLFCGLRVVICVCLLGFVFVCISQLNQTALNPLRVIYELHWLRYSDSVRVQSPNLCHLASLSLQSVGNSPI